jgi:hypothetical protein
MKKIRTCTNLICLGLSAWYVAAMICTSSPAARASVDVAIAEVKCSDNQLAADLAVAVRANLSGVPQLRISGTASAPFRVEVVCVVLDSHLLVKLRVLDVTGKRLIGVENALVARNELSGVLSQMASRISARILAASAMKTPTKPQPVEKRRTLSVAAIR